MISIQHLEKKFADTTPLKDINAEIHKGDVIAIIGPSGTGKSTLLRCINMLDPPTKGQVIIDGVDVTDKETDLKKLRHKLGMVFQSFNLFAHKMVIENIMMGPMDLLGISKQEAFDEGVKYLKMVGLGEKLYAYPDELSGGQKQRVAIARCLAMKPEIVLFDEPTSALDPTMVDEVQAVIRKLAEDGLTMMIVTHDMKFSREISNRVFYVDEGIIYEEGTPEQIFDNPTKERTRAFVTRLKTMEYSINSKDFDLYELNAKITDFAKSNYMEYRLLADIQLVLEELVLNNLIHKTEKLTIGLRFNEIDGVAQLDITYGGEKYNPYDNQEMDDLSMLLIRQKTKDVAYDYEEINHVSIKLQSIPHKNNELSEDILMNINLNKDGKNLIVALEGRLDTTTAPQLEAALTQNIEDSEKLVLDFAKLEYISSAGLRVILSAQKTMENQGSMVVQNVNETVMEVFEITGFVDIITIE